MALLISELSKALLTLLWVVANLKFQEGLTAESPEIEESNTTLVEKIRCIFEEGNRVLEKRPDYVDVTLLIGLTGAGKSTMAQVISRNLSELEAYAKGARFLIKDAGNKISHGKKTFKSWTIVPELFIDAETKSALCDFPGFSDTRGVEVEIANGHFMNEVIRHAHSVRLLVVENYSSVTGEDRERIFKLIRLTLQFVKNMAAYEGGVAFLATKAAVSASVTNKIIVDGIAESLTEAKEEMEENASKWAGKEAHIEALFSSWLKRDSNGDFVNIAFFRQPTQSGSLDTLPGLPQNRDWIRQVVLNNANFGYRPCNASDFGNPLSLAAVLKVQEIQRELLQEIKSKLVSVKDHLIEKVNKMNVSDLTLTSFGKIDDSSETFKNCGETLKLAVETIRNFGEIFGDNDRIQGTSAALEANQIYLEDLGKLPMDSAKIFNASAASIAEATAEAKRTVAAVQAAVSRKLRTEVDLNQPLEALFKELKQSMMNPELENWKMLRSFISVAQASEQIGHDFFQNIEIVSNLLEEMDSTTTAIQQRHETLKLVNDRIALLKFVDKWEPSEAPEMWKKWNTQMKTLSSSLVNFLASKAGMLIVDGFGNCSVKENSVRVSKSKLGGSCQQHILDELDSVNDLIESLAEQLNSTTAVSSRRLRRNSEDEDDDVPKVDIQTCSFPKDDLESLVKRLQRPLTSVDPSSTVVTCLTAEVSPEDSCASLVTVLKCSMQHFIRARQKSLATITTDKIENLNSAMGIMAEYAVYVDQSTATANQEMNRQWAQLSSTMRQLKLTYSCVFQEYHQLINKTISDDILLNRPAKALEWFERLHYDSETLKWVTSKAYSDFAQGDWNSGNKAKNVPQIVNFFRSLPHLEDAVSGAAVLYNEMEDNRHLQKPELVQLYNLTLDLTSDPRKACLSSDTQLKLFAVTRLILHGINSQYPNWITRFSRGSTPNNWTEFKNYAALLWAEFDAYRIVYGGYNRISAAAAVAEFISSFHNPRHAMEGFRALLQRMKELSHVNTYEYMDVMSFFRQTIEKRKLSSPEVAEAKQNVPTGLLNFFFPPNFGCHIVNVYHDTYCYGTGTASGLFEPAYCEYNSHAPYMFSKSEGWDCCSFNGLAETSGESCTKFRFTSDMTSYSNGTFFEIRAKNGSWWYSENTAYGFGAYFCKRNVRTPKLGKDHRDNVFRIKPYESGEKFTIMSAYYWPGRYYAKRWLWDVNEYWYKQPDYDTPPTDEREYWKLAC